MSSLINITPADYTEDSIVENWAGEYAEKSIREHKQAEVIDHPDGCVTSEKLSEEVREIISYSAETAELAKSTADRSVAIAGSAKEIAEFTKTEVTARADDAYNLSKSAADGTDAANERILVVENELRAVNTEIATMQEDIMELKIKTGDIEILTGDIDAALDSIISIQNQLMGVSE